MIAAWLARDIVRVSGPDAATFLQGQLSQDVAALEPGSTAWSLVLQPQGRVDAFVRVTRMTGEEFLLDTDGGWGEPLIARLNRFKLRTKADIDPLDWRCLALRGEPADGIPAPGEAAADGSTTVPFVWPGFSGVDLIGPDPAVPDGVEVGAGEDYERQRIEAGVPVMGHELDERTIPAEAGLVEMAVSFTKGCYTGQELVARIDSRGGNVPRRLRRVRVTAVVPPVGATLRAGDREVGVLTSVAADGDGAVALAYVVRAVEVPAEVALGWDGTAEPAVATVDALATV